LTLVNRQSYRVISNRWPSITPFALPMIFGGREKTETNGYCWQPVQPILESET